MHTFNVFVHVLCQLSLFLHMSNINELLRIFTNGYL